MDSGDSPSVGRTFPRRAFDDILDAMAGDFRFEYGLWDRDLWKRWVEDGRDASHCNYLVDDKGVWLRERHRWEAKDDGFLTWHPMAELDDYDQPPDLILTPVLPFPFSGSDLAAYLQNGPGCFIRSRFVEYLTRCGGDVSKAARLTVPNDACGAARIALAAAWQAAVSAQKQVGPLDKRYLVADDLDERYDTLRRKEESEAEFLARTAPYREALALIQRRSPEERVDAAQKQQEWRRAIVRHLLLQRPVVVGKAAGKSQRALTDDEIEVISKRISRGEKVQAISKEIGVSRKTIAKWCKLPVGDKPGNAKSSTTIENAFGMKVPRKSR